MLVVRQSLGGRLDRTCRAGQQSRAELALEILDLLADGGFVQVQPPAALV